MRLLLWLRWLLCDLRDGARADHVSGAWLTSQHRLEARVEHHGPSWIWPVRKAANEAGWWNRQKLRKRA